MPLLVLPDGTPLPESNVRLRRSGTGCGCGWLRLAAVWCQLRRARPCVLGFGPNCAHPFSPVHASSCTPPTLHTNQPFLLCLAGRPPQVIEGYLLDKYAGVGPSLLPPTPELRAKAQLASRIHDLYIQPLQASLCAGVGGRDVGQLPISPSFVLWGERWALLFVRERLLANEGGPCSLCADSCSPMGGRRLLIVCGRLLTRAQNCLFTPTPRRAACTRRWTRRRGASSCSPLTSSWRCWRASWTSTTGRLWAVSCVLLLLELVAARCCCRVLLSGRTAGRAAGRADPGWKPTGRLLRVVVCILGWQSALLIEAAVPSLPSCAPEPRRPPLPHVCRL